MYKHAKAPNKLIYHGSVSLRSAVLVAEGKISQLRSLLGDQMPEVEILNRVTNILIQNGISYEIAKRATESALYPSRYYSSLPRSKRNTRNFGIEHKEVLSTRGMKEKFADTHRIPNINRGSQEKIETSTRACRCGGRNENCHYCFGTGIVSKTQSIVVSRERRLPCPVCGVGVKKLERHLRRIHQATLPRDDAQSVAKPQRSAWTSWPIAADDSAGQDCRGRVIHSFDFVWKGHLYRPPVGVEGDVKKTQDLLLFSPDHARVNNEQIQVYVPPGFLDLWPSIVKFEARAFPAKESVATSMAAPRPAKAAGKQAAPTVRHFSTTKTQRGKASFTHYWSTRQCDYYSSINVAGELLDHTAGNLFRQRGIACGDKIYVVNVRNGKLHLIGRLRVDMIVSTTEAERLLKTNDLWEATEHIIALPGSSTAKRFRKIIPLEVTTKLLFESGGKYEPLLFESAGVLDRQTLRGVRRLTDASAILLEKHLEILREPHLRYDRTTMIIRTFPPKIFHRIKFGNNGILHERETTRLKEMVNHSSTSIVSAEYSKKFSQGHGLVVASWNRFDESSRAKVHALGIVVNRNAKDRRVVWAFLPQAELPRSYRPGKEHWDKPAFQIDPAVAGDFQLEELFERHRADLMDAIP